MIGNISLLNLFIGIKNSVETISNEQLDIAHVYMRIYMKHDETFDQ